MALRAAVGSVLIAVSHEADRGSCLTPAREARSVCLASVVLTRQIYTPSASTGWPDQLHLISSTMEVQPNYLRSVMDSYPKDMMPALVTGIGR